MECSRCSLVKLSSEFPQTLLLLKTCNHHKSICLRCLNSSLSSSRKCPLSTCKSDFDDFLVSTLQHEFKLASGMYDLQYISADYGDKINDKIDNKNNNYNNNNNNMCKCIITMLDGSRIELDISASSSVIDLILAFSKKSKQVHESKVQLVYKSKWLERYTKGSPTLLSSLGINAGDCVVFESFILVASLMQGDCENKMTFDLSWGYPQAGQDFLDGTCLLLRNGGAVEFIIDYSHRLYQGIDHSGDQMDSIKRVGHHLINIDLSGIPSKVRSLVFVLSSWNSPTIGHFPNPKVALYPTSNPLAVKGSTDFKSASSSQARFMCALIRTSPESKDFKIIQLGHNSSGNAKDYSAIKAYISSLPSIVISDA